MRYRKATPEESAAYDGLYPLHALIEHEGHTLYVEDLREWSDGNPQWELLAPNGFHFGDGMYLHSTLEWTLKDIKDVANTPLEPCDEGCGDSGISYLPNYQGKK